MPINNEKIVRIACAAALTLPLEQLQPLQGGLKKLSPENAAKLRREIVELGFSAPFHVWQSDHGNYILDGHQRFAVLAEMQIEGWIVPDLPVALIDATDVSEAKRKLLALASSYGHMTPQSLSEYLEDAGIAFDEAVERYELPDINYEAMRELLTDEGFWREEEEENKLPDDKIDDVPEILDSFVQPGEIWQLGNHRLMCGDSTKREDVERLMDGKKADMVFTDPPYGVSYEKKCHDIFHSNRVTSKITNDDISVDDLTIVIRAAFKNINAFIEDKSTYYICSPQGGDMGLMMMMMKEENIPCRHVIIWLKNAPVFSMGRLDYDYQHEPILFGWSPNRSHHKNTHEGQWQSSTWPCNREVNKLDPTMKPVDLMVNAITNSCPSAGRVMDLFLGSGSTMIACEQTNRRCFGMEIDPHYCSVAITRWQDLTGKTAHRVEPT